MKRTSNKIFSIFQNNKPIWNQLTNNKYNDSAWNEHNKKKKEKKKKVRLPDFVRNSC